VEMKIRMLQLGIKQQDLIRMLYNKGIIVEQADVSRAVNGWPQQRFKKIRAEIDEILTEKEQNNELQKSTV